MGYFAALISAALAGPIRLIPWSSWIPGAGNAREAVEPFQELAPKVNGRAAALTGLEDDPDELGVGQFVRSLLQEPLPRPLIFRPVLEVCSLFVGQVMFPRGIQVRAR